MQYFDKNGVEIKSGMTLRMADGSEELVYDTTNAYGNPDLGINASNEEYLERHPYSRKRINQIVNSQILIRSKQRKGFFFSKTVNL